MMQMITIEQGSDEWKAMRKTKIGASDAPVLMNVSPYTTPYQMWMEKVMDVQKEENAAMSFGRQNEEPARQLFENMTGLVVSPAVASHLERSWQIASLDGIDMEGTTLVEIKCANEKDHSSAVDGKVPDKYFPQLQHQLAVTGFPIGFYFSYHKGKGIIVEVKRDDDYIQKMIKVEEKFYFDNLLGREPPELTARDYVQRSDNDWKHLAANYMEINQTIKELEAKEKALRDRLIQAAGRQNCSGSGVVVSRSFPKGRVDYEAIPELKSVNLDLYRKPSKEQWRITLHG